MGKVAKAVGLAALVVALKGSYHLGKTAGEDARYDLTRRESVAYLVDKTTNEYARLDEARSLRDQPAFCPPPPVLPRSDNEEGGYLGTIVDYLRRVFE